MPGHTSNLDGLIDILIADTDGVKQHASLEHDKVCTHRRKAVLRVLRRIPADERDRLAAAFDSFASAAGEPSPGDTAGVLI